MKHDIYNPFIIGHYVGDEYFCDRDAETAFLLKQVRNGRNVTLVSPRRIGKSDLIHHFFNQKEVKNNYYTFFVDIYATNSLAEFVYLLGKTVFESLKPFHRKILDGFFKVITSLRVGFSLDPMTGEPTFDMSVGDISSPETTLREIFEYLNNADRRCIIAIDEFQKIVDYNEKNVEALLRTYIQQCPNATFIYSGSKRDVMTNMFQSASKPFYGSTITMGLDPLPKQTYIDFAKRLFCRDGRNIGNDVINEVYDRYGGSTWFVQVMMNELFDITSPGGECHIDELPKAENNIIMVQSMGYKETMAHLSVRQRELIIAIAKERKAVGVTSAQFTRKYGLTSPSSVQAALKPLLADGLVTQDDDAYYVYDFFMAEWIRKMY